MRKGLKNGDQYISSSSSPDLPQKHDFELHGVREKLQLIAPQLVSAIHENLLLVQNRKLLIGGSVDESHCLNDLMEQRLQNHLPFFNRGERIQVTVWIRFPGDQVSMELDEVHELQQVEVTQGQKALFELLVSWKDGNFEHDWRKRHAVREDSPLGKPLFGHFLPALFLLTL